MLVVPIEGDEFRFGLVGLYGANNFHVVAGGRLPADDGEGG